MQRKFLSLSLAAVACFSILIWGCNKIDTTTLGADLIPAVDNIHTFADTLLINASREPLTDTTRLTLAETHVLGNIKNDPIFGKTKADLFLQMKPTFFPYYYGQSGDSILSFDSAFLCLAYSGYYGDTNTAQNLKVYSLDPNTNNFKDSAYLLNYTPDMPFAGNLIGQASIVPKVVSQLTFLNYKKDSVSNQIRIKLDPSFLAKIKTYDSSANPGMNAYHSDSLFKEMFKGFAIVADDGSPGNGLFYISPTGPNTRMEVYFTRKSTLGVVDTSYSSWTVADGSSFNVTASAHATNLKRDTSASEFPNSPQPGALYLETAPGYAINLSIPALTNYPNRIIHRAEIILEQIPGDPALDAIYTAPPFLYLDLIDDTAMPKKYKPVYYDLSPTSFYNPDDATTFFPTNGADHTYYGGYVKTISDQLGGTRSSYFFNLTRYVQNMITQKTKNYKLRVYAPYNLTYNGYSLPYNNNLAYGRIKLGDGTNTNFKLRMRIVYSNL
ncbi:hypothetical protein BH11BAC3_BH11BAC3_16390 [soil metagenome]